MKKFLYSLMTMLIVINFIQPMIVIADDQNNSVGNNTQIDDIEKESTKESTEEEEQSKEYVTEEEEDSNTENNQNSNLASDNSMIGYSNSYEDLTVTYQAHVQDIGWQKAVSNGEIAGTTGKSKRMEAIQIGINNQLTEGSINYSTYVEGLGWQDSVSDNAISGTVKQCKRIEAIRISLTGELNNRYDIYYRVHVSEIGWLDWTSNGNAAGTIGYQGRVEAIQIQIVPKGSTAPGDTTTPYLEQELQAVYQAHVQDIGWQKAVSNGEIAGTTGKSKRVEAIQIGLNHNLVEGSVNYSTYVEGLGWQDSVSDNAISGTVKQCKRIEAIRISLTGELNNQYDIYYRVHVSEIGWLGWTSNGNAAGTIGYQGRVEAIQIQIVPKGSAAPGDTTTPYLEQEPQAVYQVYLQDMRWQAAVSNGEMAGTIGQSRRMEAIQISLSNLLYNGDIQYRVHVQDIGWQDWVSNGEMAGTTGKSKRIEAIEIKLTDELASKYDIYYRAYIQNYGWLGWTSNGSTSGSTSCSYRMEAIQIKIVPKGSAAPGSTSNSYITSYWKTVGDTTYYYRDGVMVTDWQVIGGVKYYFNKYGELIARNAKKIIDVSYAQGTIDWDTVAKSGEIDGVIIRVAGNAINQDTQLENNINAVKRLGIPYGIYIYSYAENYNEGVVYANYVKSLMSKYSMNPTLGIYLDLESNSITQYMGTTHYETVVRGFMSVIPSAKIYTYYSYANTALNTTYLRSYITWIARYNTYCGYTGNYNGWQYTSEGRVSGISGNVDISVFGSFVS